MNKGMKPLHQFSGDECHLEWHRAFLVAWNSAFREDSQAQLALHQNLSWWQPEGICPTFLAIVNGKEHFNGKSLEKQVYSGEFCCFTVLGSICKLCQLELFHQPLTWIIMHGRCYTTLKASKALQFMPLAGKGWFHFLFYLGRCI